MKRAEDEAKRDLKEKYDALVDEMMDFARSIQTRYDDETGHGQYVSQIDWQNNYQQKIDEALDE